MTSTEIYQGGKWQEVGPLPNPLRDHRAATLSNAVFISGNTSILYHARTSDFKPISSRALLCLVITLFWTLLLAYALCTHIMQPLIIMYYMFIVNCSGLGGDRSTRWSVASDGSSQDILWFDSDSETWTKTGEMMIERWCMYKTKYFGRF